MERNVERFAVVGAGVAGIVAAHLLSQAYDVTLIEAEDDVGGHTNTVVIPDGPDAGTPVDTGFIVLNDANYPLLNRFFAELGVSIQPSDMSFGFHCRTTGLTYSSDFPRGTFAQPRNLFNRAFLGMIRETLRFNRAAVRDLESGRLAGQTVGEYLVKNRYSKAFVEDQLVPSAAAVWSAPTARILDFPVEALVRFYHHHGMLSHVSGPRWHTVVGGSRTYVKRFLERFPGAVLTSAPVRAVTRRDDGVTLQLADGRALDFDRVAIAAHADQALRLLADPSPEEKRLLGVWSYSKNHTVLHSDEAIMGPQRRAWASWNYIRDVKNHSAHPVTVTYYMNRLQRLKTQASYFVSLNDPKAARAERVVAEFCYTHPRFGFEAMALQPELPRLNGRRRTYFCGSYFGYGFHEDAVRSSVQLAETLGLSL